MKTRIKETRLKLNMNQETLAERAKIDIRQVHRIENDKCNPRIDTLINIAAALETTVGYLLYENERKTK